MIEEYVPMDRRHDNFYERHLEQRIQMLNQPEHPSMKDSVPFPIEPLRPAPVTLPPKRVSNTSSDSRVNSPLFISPEFPKTTHNSQPYIVPSTSRTKLPSGLLTPIQQFIRKPKTKESKYNCSQPDHPEPQSVLRNRTRQNSKL